MVLAIVTSSVTCCVMQRYGKAEPTGLSLCRGIFLPPERSEGGIKITPYTEGSS